MNTFGEKILKLAIDELNLDYENEKKIPLDPSTEIMGDNGLLDSLSLVRLLTSIERIIEEETGKAVVIVDESSYENEESPFATLRSLSKHIDLLNNG